MSFSSMTYYSLPLQYNPERDSVVPGPVPSPEKGVSTATAGGQQQINMTTTTHYSKVRYLLRV